MTPTAENFDWVTARSECSLTKVFGRLSLGIQSDVEIRKELPSDDWKFDFFPQQPRAFMVTRQNSRGDHRQVDFLIKDGTIAILGTGVSFAARPGLNTSGRCTLMVNGQELELWQVRRMALDGLFFDA